MKRLFAILLSCAGIAMPAFGSYSPFLPPLIPIEEGAYYAVTDVVGKSTRLELFVRVGEIGTIEYNNRVVAIYLLSSDGHSRKLTTPNNSLEVVIAFEVPIFHLPNGATAIGKSYIQSREDGRESDVNEIIVTVKREGGLSTFTYVEKEGDLTEIGIYTFAPGSLLPERHELKTIKGQEVIMHVIKEKTKLRPYTESAETDEKPANSSKQR